MDRIIDVKYLLAFGIDLCDLIFCRHVIRHQTIVPCASLPSIPPSHSSAINGWFVNLCVWANYNLFALIKLGLGNEKLATYCFHSQLPTKIISKHSPSVAISSGRSSFVFRRFPLIFERVLHHRIIIIIDHHFPLHIPIPIHLAAATIYTADKSTVPFRYWKSLIPIIRMLSLCLNHNNVQWDVPNFVFATNFILILTYYSYSFILRLDTPWRLSQSAIHCIEQPSSPMNYHQHDPP